MPHRTEQTESAILRAVSKVLAEGLADPRYKGLATVTRVKLDTDRRCAAVGISIMPAEAEAATIAAIRHAAAHIRREVGQTIRTRRVPQLDFQLDQSLKRQAEVLGAIQQAMADTPPEAGEAPSPTTDPAKGDPPL